MFDPKARSMLQKEVSIIQGKMMDRAMYVFSKYEEVGDVEKLETFDILMNLYNKYTQVLIHEVLIPLDDPGRQVLANSSTFTNLIRRLNRGYANFVYDTTPSRLTQFIEEERRKKNLNDEGPQEQNPKTEDPFLDENLEGDN